MIQRNKHAAGRFANIIFGLANVVDGLVRAGSLGMLHTTLPLKVSKYQAKLLINRMKGV